MNTTPKDKWSLAPTSNHATTGPAKAQWAVSYKSKHYPPGVGAAVEGVNVAGAGVVCAAFAGLRIPG